MAVQTGVVPQRQANRLAGASSPYLLQHAHKPVDWYPWGDEAFAKARAEDRPVFLSVGYAACNWCHVMERESFEDEATAGLLNERFVAIKVDREERPDVDGIYMDAVQAMTGSGGWPMSVFLTPGGKPFYAGTYFPDQPRHGLPSFRQVLDGIADAWMGPHFEKMLYDNAQLALLYARAWLVTRNDNDREISSRTLDYLLHEMRHPQGGFFSSLDADSEGVEGKFYVWSWEELVSLVGEDAAEAFGATPEGNWDGTNVLRASVDDALREVARMRLFEAREARVR